MYRLYIMLFVFMLATAIGVGEASLSQLQKEQILSIHNQVRAEKGVAPLVWNNNLAIVAQNYADDCIWGHNAQRSVEYSKVLGAAVNGGVGENLAAATSGWQTVGGLVDMWVEERQYWKYPSSCATGRVCGHYTQMIWHSTTQIGCGLSKCDLLSNIRNAEYLVCDYAPAGNIIGRPPY